MTNEIVILAGGLATRLYPVTKEIPKSMIEIAGKPFIVHQLELLKRNGIDKVILCVGFLGEKIRDYIKDGSEFGLKVEYSYDGDNPLGTGGAIKKALPMLGDSFFVMYGDSYLNIEFKPINEYFASENEPALMTVLENENKWDVSNVIFKDGKIVQYDKENLTDDMKYIDFGLGILSKKAFKLYGVNEKFDLADLYKKLVSREELLGYIVKERFYEIGSPEGLEETRKYLSKLNT